MKNFKTSQNRVMCKNWNIKKDLKIDILLFLHLLIIFLKYHTKKFWVFFIRSVFLYQKQLHTLKHKHGFLRAEKIDPSERKHGNFDGATF